MLSGLPDGNLNTPRYIFILCAYWFLMTFRIKSKFSCMHESLSGSYRGLCCLFSHADPPLRNSQGGSLDRFTLFHTQNSNTCFKKKAPEAFLNCHQMLKRRVRPCIAGLPRALLTFLCMITLPPPAHSSASPPGL